EGPKKASGERSTSPLRFRLQEEQRGTVLIETRAGQVSLSEGTWSEWMVLPFELAPGTAVSGQVRFYVESASPDRLHVYSSAVGADPANPFVVLSHPPEMAGMLQERAGRYNTVGWSEDTSALNAELLPDGAFLEDLLRTMDQREKMAVQSVKGEDPHLLISVWTGTDRVAHMFWRLTDPAAPRYDPELARQYGDAIDRVYDRMDVSVGEVRKYIEEDTVLIVLSDHGFHPFHRGVHLNRWLVREGYLSLKEGGSSLADADWSRSRAYALGTGQIYLNLVGREGQGVVSFGAVREVLLAEIRKGLLALKDPDTGTRVSAEVHLGSELYSGPAMVDAPDLQIAFTSGYQASWATRLGGVPAELVERNAKKWSGDHAASAASDTEGVLFVNKPLVGDSPGIEDLAPTLLQLFGKERPPEMDGKPIL
ncbi:MAG: alkaline phosphatase family protein, partial [Myxococcota bacterium]|nr:alkaline phosphatase family protein [Myxococcota bacterium]